MLINNLKYGVSYLVSAVGCATTDLPAGVWVTRQATGVVVRCNATGEVWHLTCVDNRWIGRVGNCSHPTGSKCILCPQPCQIYEVNYVRTICTSSRVRSIIMSFCGFNGWLCFLVRFFIFLFSVFVHYINIRICVERREEEDRGHTSEKKTA